jgi:hypothetical protein
MDANGHGDVGRRQTNDEAAALSGEVGIGGWEGSQSHQRLGPPALRWWQISTKGTAGMR